LCKEQRKLPEKAVFSNAPEPLKSYNEVCVEDMD